MSIKRGCSLIDYTQAYGDTMGVNWTEPPDVPMDTLPPVKGRAKVTVDAETGEIHV